MGSQEMAEMGSQKWGQVINLTIVGSSLGKILRFSTIKIADGSHARFITHGHAWGWARMGIHAWARMGTRMGTVSLRRETKRSPISQRFFELPPLSDEITEIVSLKPSNSLYRSSFCLFCSLLTKSHTHSTPSRSRELFFVLRCVVFRMLGTRGGFTPRSLFSTHASSRGVRIDLSSPRLGSGALLFFSSR